MNLATLGIDIGGVIIDDRTKESGKKNFEGNPNFLEVPQIPGAIKTISEIRERRFKKNIHLVSSCSQKMEDLRWTWLGYHKFFDQTGILKENVHFCRTRKEKADICYKYGITHYIDNRLEILFLINTLVNVRILFRPRAREMQKYRQYLPNVKQVSTWEEVQKILLNRE